MGTKWFVVVLSVALFLWTGTNAAPPAKPSGCKPLYGVSYDPFQFSTNDICISAKQVAIDVEIMATVAKSIRIYSLAVCPEATWTILEESKKHNLTVMLGILINTDSTAIEKELALLPQLMKNHSDVVQAVVVGNQALGGERIGSKSRFAKEMSNVEILSSYIIRVKGMLRRKRYEHPVTTSESWIVWESKHGFPISESIDFLCLNLNPYYEGFEVECFLSAKGKCTTAAEYVADKAKGISDYYNKDVWVCETSWPTDGNSCCGGLFPYQQEGNKAKAAPSVASKYLKSFAKQISTRPYYIASAFDRDWRRIWAPCPSCAEKNLAISSFPNGQCNLCEEEYKIGVFDQYREPSERLEIPSVKCKLPRLPKIRIAVEEIVTVEKEEVEKVKKSKKKKEKTESKTTKKTDDGEETESVAEVTGEKKTTKKGAEKTVVKSTTSEKTKTPISKTDGSTTTTGSITKNVETKAKAETKTTKTSTSAKAKSVVKTSSSKTKTKSPSSSESSKVD